MPKTPKLGASRAAAGGGAAKAQRRATTGGFVARPMPDYTAMSAQGINASVKPRAPTVPEGPRISQSAKRAPTAAEPGASAGKGFVARPVPDYAAMGAKGVKSVKPRAPTVPHSPEVMHHPSSHRAAVVDENEGKGFVAQPMPDFNTAIFVPKHSSKVR